MKNLLIITAFVFGGLVFSTSANAQVVITKPKQPTVLVKKGPKPTTKGTWVWVAGHWEWKKQSKTYKWVKAQWKKAPKKKKYWKKGHWKKVKKGWEWSSGYWM
ncbi:MAG: hypothetical protein DRJ10_16715 [Bacteroidetes bacterium]|nr:MAG: hypothetical protein DRJ10_16715 [Bacteroidota bacterium]